METSASLSGLNCATLLFTSTTPSLAYNALYALLVYTNIALALKSRSTLATTNNIGVYDKRSCCGLHGYSCNVYFYFLVGHSNIAVFVNIPSRRAKQVLIGRLDGKSCIPTHGVSIYVGTCSPYVNSYKI